MQHRWLVLAGLMLLMLAPAFANIDLKHDLYVAGGDGPSPCWYSGGYHEWSAYILADEDDADHFLVNDVLYYQEARIAIPPLWNIAVGGDTWARYRVIRYVQHCGGFAAYSYIYRINPGYTLTEIYSAKYGGIPFIMRQKNGKLCVNIYYSGGVRWAHLENDHLVDPDASDCQYPSVGRYNLARAFDLGKQYYTLISADSTHVIISDIGEPVKYSPTTDATVCGVFYAGGKVLVAENNAGYLAFQYYYMDTNILGPLTTTSIPTACGSSYTPADILDYDDDGQLEIATGKDSTLYFVEAHEDGTWALDALMNTPVPMTYIGTYRPTNPDLEIYLTNFPPSISRITYSPSNPTDTDTVNFTATVSDPDGDTVTCNWDFGDGATATGCTASHVFAQGTYTVTVTACDTEHCVSDSVDVTVIHANDPPTVSTVDCVQSVVMPYPYGYLECYADVYDPNGDPVTCSWTLGGVQVDATDCSHISVQVPQTNIGVYTVTLTACDDDNACSSGSDMYRVDNPPDISPTYTPANPTTADTVTFYANASDPDGDTVSCTWYYGDGTQSGVACDGATHQYTTEGTYTVSVQACDSWGICTSQGFSVPVSRANSPPSVNFTYSPSTPTDENDVTYTPTVTDPDGDAFTCSWDLGDGTEVNTCDTVSHRYAEGTYTVTLSACDEFNACTSVSKSITVYHQNHPPSVDFTYSPSTPTTDENVTFTAIVSDPDGDSITCRWTFEYATTYDTCDPVTYQFTTSGSHTVQLEACDSYNDCSSRSKTVTVALGNRPPSVLLTASSTQTDNITPIAFYLHKSDPDGDTVTCKWDFGDGTTSTECGTVTHQYYNAGTYTVTVTVCDDTNACASDSVTVTVEQKNILPVADLWIEPATPFVGSDANILCSYSDPDGQVVRVQITTGDGGEYNECNVMHVFTRYGDISVRLDVVDDHGGITTITRTVTVLPSASGGITGLAIMSSGSTALNWVLYVISSILSVIVAIIANSFALWLLISLYVARRAYHRAGPEKALYVFIGVIWLGYILHFIGFWTAALITVAVLVIADSRGMNVPIISEVREKLQEKIQGGGEEK